MINPFELSRLLDKTHHLKTKKDPIAPWIIGSLSWGGGIYAQKSIRILPPPPSANAPHRSLYHFIAQFAPWLLVAIIATGLALGLWAIARKRRHKATIPPHLRPITYAHWALFAFTLGLIAARPVIVQSPPELTRCTITATIEDIQPGTTQATIAISQYACDQTVTTKLHPASNARISLMPNEAQSLRIGTIIQANGTFSRYKGPNVPGAFDASTWAKNTGLSGFFKRNKTAPEKPSKSKTDRSTTNKHSQSPADSPQAYTPPPFESLLIISTPKWNLLSWLNAKRRSAYDILQAHSSSGIMPALILGTTRGIDDATRDDFGRLGIAHVLAVSGMHFGIIAFIIVVALRWLISRSPYVMRRWGRRRLSLLLMFPILCIYLFFVDAPLSAQRALIMLAMCNLGQITGRKCDKVRAFLFAAIVMTAINPSVIFSISFQLSFAAVLGIIWCTDFYAKYVQIHILSLPLPQRMTKIIDSCASALVITIATSMTTAPFVLYHFGQLPILGTLTNLIVIPWVTFILMPAMIVATFAIIARIPMHEHIATTAQKLEDYTCAFASFANAHIPVACIDVLPNFALSLATAAVVCLVWIRLRPTKWRIYLAIIPAIALSIVVGAFAMAPQALTKPNGIRMTFVAMGQADATLIEFPNGKNMLIDAGAEVSRQSNATQTQLIPFLEQRGIRTIDIFVITHWDYDHVAGIPHLFEQNAFTIGEIWHNGFASDDERWQRAIDQSGIPSQNIQQLPSNRSFGNANIHVLWPNPSFPITATNDDIIPTNDTSIVLRVSIGHFSALLMGDAPESIERQIMLSDPQLTANATVLKAGHHGSKTSSSKPYIAHVNPRYAIFSVGQNNRYKFPHFDVESTFFEQKTKMLRTDTNGTIQITSDGYNMHISTMYP